MKKYFSTLPLILAIFGLATLFVSCEESNDKGILDGNWTVEETQQDPISKDVYSVTISSDIDAPTNIQIQNFLNLNNNVFVHATFLNNKITIRKQEIVEDAFKSATLRLKGETISSWVEGNGTYDPKTDQIHLNYTHFTSDEETNVYSAVCKRK